VHNAEHETVQEDDIALLGRDLSAGEEVDVFLKKFFSAKKDNKL